MRHLLKADQPLVPVAECDDDDDVHGMPVWAWTMLWLLVGIVIGTVGTLVASFLIIKRKQQRAEMYRQAAGRSSRPTPAAAGAPPLVGLRASAARMSGKGENGTLGSQHSQMSAFSEFGQLSSEKGSANAMDRALPATPPPQRPLTPAEHRMRTIGESTPLAASLQDPAMRVSAVTERSSTAPLPAPQPAAAPGHARTVSAVSSVGPSGEYDEEELDEEWLSLLEEVDGALRALDRHAIASAKERAIVVNSLLVSTGTRPRHECVRNATKDILMFRKMEELKQK